MDFERTTGSKGELATKEDVNSAVGAWIFLLVVVLVFCLVIDGCVYRRVRATEEKIDRLEELLLTPEERGERWYRQQSN